MSWSMMTSMAELLFSPYIAAAEAILLTWWAARTRDGAAFRIVALVLVIVPVVLLPLLTLSVQFGDGPIAQRMMVPSIAGAVAGLTRALFLLVWAVISKDKAGLRVGGGVIAGLQLAHLLLLLISATLLTWKGQF